jgi:hypothetical protein
MATASSVSFFVSKPDWGQTELVYAALYRNDAGVKAAGVVHYHGLDLLAPPNEYAYLDESNGWVSDFELRGDYGDVDVDSLREGLKTAVDLWAESHGCAERVNGVTLHLSSVSDKPQAVLVSDGDIKVSGEGYSESLHVVGDFEHTPDLVKTVTGSYSINEHGQMLMANGAVISANTLSSPINYGAMLPREVISKLFNRIREDREWLPSQRETIDLAEQVALNLKK